MFHLWGEGGGEFGLLEGLGGVVQGGMEVVGESEDAGVELGGVCGIGSVCFTPLEEGDLMF